MAKNNSKMTFETKDFDIKFPRVINKEIPEAAATTAFKVAAMVIRDAILEEPRAPHITGNLWRSQKIESPKIERGEITIELGFDAEYAAAVHEMPAPYQKPTMTGSGPKFLEAKLIRNKEKYMAEIAAGLRRKAGK
ncbi:MAG: HK97 gp10 family phage protein [Desulfobacteraceae bacterium]|nr:HK97 gp10 family phage protein [Desulfobacteraceae bacterium]